MIADGARLMPECEDAASHLSLFPVVDPATASPAVRGIFEEIGAFFDLPAAPQVFWVMAADEG